MNDQEVWAIVREDGKYLPPIDEDSTSCFLAWPTEEEAEKGLTYQQEMWGDLGNLKIVRVA